MWFISKYGRCFVWLLLASNASWAGHFDKCHSDKLQGWTACDVMPIQSERTYLSISEVKAFQAGHSSEVFKGTLNNGTEYNLRVGVVGRAMRE